MMVVGSGNEFCWSIEFSWLGVFLYAPETPSFEKMHSKNML